MSDFLGKAAALARDWVAPGDAIAQWTHFVTSTCNAKCRHCFYPINQRTDELTLAELEKLAATLPPIRLLLISGGEPFLRRDLPELLRVYWERCRFFSVSIPTNGFSAERIAETVRRICAISPDLQLGMTVSLDGFEEFHDAMRQVPGLYRKATETLRALVALSAELPNLTAGVNTVFMNANQDRMDEFCAMIRSEFAPTYHSLILVRGKPADPQLDMSVDVPKFRRISRWLDERYSGQGGSGLARALRTRARHTINRERFEYIARQASGGGFEQFCLAGEREYILTEQGDVYGCELIGDKLGNVREAGYDFRRIRAGEAAAAFVRAKRERLCRCTHECNARTMILFNRKNAPTLVAGMLGAPRSGGGGD